MKISVQFKAGGSFVKLSPIFSSSFEYVYVAWKNQVLGYSTKTGVQTAVFDGLKKRIVGFALHYYNNFQCITACSSQGEVITWKVDTHLKIFNKEVACHSVRSFHLLSSESNEPVALIALSHKQTLSFQLYNLEDSAIQNYDLHLLPTTVHVDVSSDQFFAVAQKHVLYVAHIKDFEKSRKFSIKDRKFTCLVCHPKEEAILTGDDTGRIILWKGLFSGNLSKAIFHWHTLPVRCLRFSTNGSHFYSGGEEAVLVQWQDNDHLEKKFLPRLQSAIKQISVCGNNSLIAVATADNGVKIIDSRFASVGLIQNMVIGENCNSGIVCDFRTKSIIMNGNVGQIQLYSPENNILMHSVDVVGQNKISNERICNIENTQVSKVAISKNGFWMATAEVRRDLDYCLEQRLKFWNFDLNAQNFKLNTSIEDPHQNEINALKFQPSDTSELKCISVGDDKKFKIWILDEVETVEGGKKVWTCLSVGYLHGLNCKGLSISTDGSLLAVGFKNILTTWLTDTCHLKCSLFHRLCNEEITHIEFGNSLQAHLLVAATTNRLSVWNLLTLTMIWSVPMNVSILIADSISTNMAVFTENKTLFVFCPLSPQPIYESKDILDSVENIYEAAFVPSKCASDGSLRWYQRSPIYFIDAARELHYIGTNEEAIETSFEIEKSEVSLFGLMKPQVQKEYIKDQNPASHLFYKDNSQRSLEKYLEAPIETMIPIRLMCKSLLTSMVLQKS